MVNPAFSLPETTRNCQNAILVHCNFLLATLPAGQSAEQLYQQLKSENILVRFFNQERLQDKLRISVGTPAENATLLAALTRKFT